MPEFFIQPLEGRRVGRLVIRQVELLDGQLAEQAAHKLLCQVVVQQVIIQRHAEKAWRLKSVFNRW